MDLKNKTIVTWKEWSGNEWSGNGVTSSIYVLFLSLLVRSFSKRGQNLDGISKASFNVSQSAFACSKLTIETLEQGVKHVQS